MMFLRQHQALNRPKHFNSHSLYDIHTAQCKHDTRYLPSPHYIPTYLTTTQWHILSHTVKSWFKDTIFLYHSQRGCFLFHTISVEIKFFFSFTLSLAVDQWVKWVDASNLASLMPPWAGHTTPNAPVLRWLVLWEWACYCEQVGMKSDLGFASTVFASWKVSVTSQ